MITGARQFHRPVAACDSTPATTPRHFLRASQKPAAQSRFGALGRCGPRESTSKGQRVLTMRNEVKVRQLDAYCFTRPKRTLLQPEMDCNARGPHWSHHCRLRLGLVKGSSFEWCRMCLPPQSCTELVPMKPSRPSEGEYRSEELSRSRVNIFEVADRSVDEYTVWFLAVVLHPLVFWPQRRHAARNAYLRTTAGPHCQSQNRPFQVEDHCGR